MLRTNALVGMVAAVLLTVAWQDSSGQGGKITPLPNVTCPGVPDQGPCCLWQIHKSARGERKITLDPKTKTPCPDTGTTLRGTATLTLTLKSGDKHCDQVKRFIPDGSVIVATGKIIEREDGLAHFIGEFKLQSPQGKPLFQGCIETIDRIESHSEPVGKERCDPKNHFEGWLTGRWHGDDRISATLRALLVASVSENPKGQVLAGINGTIITFP